MTDPNESDRDRAAAPRADSEPELEIDLIEDLDPAQGADDVIGGGCTLGSRIH